ncbi:hypothetical protein G5I_06015 [Acromyrmex echinatior]|uniref:Uncharacterized protein n=1 Tax=Acromyrmex echinatior TaxID=103372 RepID=F4WJY1_ACREC|nr:hypothetical protein G5I_06015 [Acromyrmex echinatior]
MRSKTQQTRREKKRALLLHVPTDIVNVTEMIYRNTFQYQIIINIAMSNIEFPVSFYLKLIYATTVTIDFQTDFQMYSIDTRLVPFETSYYNRAYQPAYLNDDRNYAGESVGIRVVNISITKAIAGTDPKGDTINGRATRKVTPTRIEKRQTVYPAYKYKVCVVKAKLQVNRIMKNQL